MALPSLIGIVAHRGFLVGLGNSCNRSRAWPRWSVCPLPWSGAPYPPHTSELLEELAARPGKGRHRHHFAVRGLVLSGTFLVSQDSDPVTYGRGQIFAVAEGELHDESIARVLVGREFSKAKTSGGGASRKASDYAGGISPSPLDAASFERAIRGDLECSRRST